MDGQAQQSWRGVNPSKSLTTEHLDSPSPHDIKRVVVLGDYEKALAAQLRRFLPSSEFTVQGYEDAEKREEVLFDRLCDAHVAVVIRERTPLPHSLLSRLGGLQLVVTTGTNTSVVALDTKVPVTFTRSQTSAAAEHTWALILTLARGVPEQEARLREGLWQNSLGIGLEGKTLGVLGLGRVGNRVAAVGRAFNMRLLAWSPHMTAERAESHGAQFTELGSLFAQADIVTLHLRLGEETRGIVDTSLLKESRDGLLLVNTSRAGLINDGAVVDALRKGQLGGLAQDVFTEEPISSSDPLFAAPRTLLTPHLGYATDDNFDVFATDVSENIENFYAGKQTRRLNA